MHDACCMDDSAEVYEPTQLVAQTAAPTHRENKAGLMYLLRPRFHALNDNARNNASPEASSAASRSEKALWRAVLRALL